MWRRRGQEGNEEGGTEEEDTGEEKEDGKKDGKKEGGKGEEDCDQLQKVPTETLKKN